MSFGTLTDAKVLRDAIDYARAGNVVLVASAGNNNTSAPQYPAAYSGVIAVAATDLLDRKASFSNYGSSVFVDAPGTHIISAMPWRLRYCQRNVLQRADGCRHGRSDPLVAVRGHGDNIAQSTVRIDSRNPPVRRATRIRSDRYAPGRGAR